MSYRFPDAKKNKIIYNERFNGEVDTWSVTDINVSNFVITEIVKYISTKGFFLDKKKSLDIGCAKGHFTEALRVNGLESFGLDYSDIAISKAKKLFPKCTFLCMDGFNPQLEENFDLIFMRGFSGTNTHDLDFVADMCNKYVLNLNLNGWFILSYTTNFSGQERDKETVNWTDQEISKIGDLLNLTLDNVLYIEDTLKQKTKNLIRKILLGKTNKQTFYMIFKRTK